MTISKSVAVFVAAQRELLDRLERFAEIEHYLCLKAAAGPWPPMAWKAGSPSG